LLPAVVAGGVVVGASAALKYRSYTAVIGVATVLIALQRVVKIASAYAHNVTHLAQWDYLCFWLYGQTLAHHLDPYGPHSLRALPLPQPVDAEFSRDVLSVGIPYPPWSLVLFRPLGFFSDPHQGAMLWCAVEFAALLAAVVVISRWRSLTWNGAAAVAALVFLLPPSFATAGYAQTIPLTLLFLALYMVRIDKLDGGIWLAAAAVVKPFVLLVLLVPLLRRSWGQLAAAIGTLVIMTAIGLAIAGPTAFVDYVRESPIVRTPGSVLTESNNVPVVAYFLRAAHVMPPNAASLPPSLVALNLSLLLIGVSVAALVARRNAVLAFCAVLTLALLVYPQSNIHYAQLLALPLLALWRDPVFERRPLAMATLICGAYALLSVAGGADTMFATLLVWVICLATSLRGEPSVSLWRKKSGLPARCEPVFP